MHENLKQRFFNKVRKTSKCWVWTGACNSAGYGMLKVEGRNKKAHRISYEIHKGAIQQNMDIMHKCDTPCCVNPSHLVSGTTKDNMVDCALKGRHQFQKLTSKDIPVIRKMYKDGVTQREIGKQYGVARETIKNVITGHRWSYVA